MDECVKAGFARAPFTERVTVGAEGDQRGFPSEIASAFLLRQEQVESNARTYPRRLPIVLQSGEGIRVTDVAGREYIDCLAGAGALALGHNHPVVTEAIHRALDSGVILQTLDLATPLKDRFVSALYASLPPALASEYKIQFCGPSGSDAIEAALKLAKTATGRQGVFSFRGAYHGMTLGALSVSGEIEPKAAIGAIGAEVQFLPFPSDYRCPFGLGGPAGAQAGVNYLDALLDDPNSGLRPPAAIIVEPIQGEGGVNPAPDEWLRGVATLARRHGVPLILDEVQTGLGRSGALYAFEHAGVTPDILVLSKAIGGGLPLAVVLYRRALDVWRPGAHAGTFRGNQLAFATGAAVVRHIVGEKLHLNAALRGAALLAALRRVAQEAHCIGDVRGRGLMIGVEIAQAPGAARESDAGALVRRIQGACLRRGLIVERGGRGGSVLRFLPPLIVTEADVDEIASRFRDAVLAAEASRD